MKNEIDAIDRRIITLLQVDGRASNVDIGRSLGLAEATVRKRIERLLADGVMRIVAVPATERLGLPLETVIMLKVDLDKVSRVGEQLATLKEVRSVQYTTGVYDIILEAVFPSDDELLEFLASRLSSIPGIRDTATSHVLRSIKRSCDWTLPHGGPPHILVVDDDPDFVETTRLVLESAGLQVTAAANGEQALVTMKREQPDLVILDVMMSGILDGVQASRSIRSDERLKRVPLLMISSITSSDYAGMFPTDEHLPVDNFLSKPVNPAQLLSEVKRLLGP
jgi:Lrp/AsnC family transcriptional regulator, regulator for asnA, asnC and gidA